MRCVDHEELAREPLGDHSRKRAAAASVGADDLHARRHRAVNLESVGEFYAGLCDRPILERFDAVQVLDPATQVGEVSVQRVAAGQPAADATVEVVGGWLTWCGLVRLDHPPAKQWRAGVYPEAATVAEQTSDQSGGHVAAGGDVLQIRVHPQ